VKGQPIGGYYEEHPDDACIQLEAKWALTGLHVNGECKVVSNAGYFT